jgi:RNA polymerase sigma-70 factor (ECF subfamily)
MQDHVSRIAGVPMPLDAHDLARLYDRHAGELLAFLARRTCDPEASLDLLGETFASAFEDRMKFRGGEAEARAWLYGIARHRLIDYLRRGRVELRALRRLGVERRALTDGEYDRIEELSASRELRSQLAEPLAALTTEQREVLRLRVVEERSYAEIARTLDISEQTARARASRALRALRESTTFSDLLEASDDARRATH